MLPNNQLKLSAAKPLANDTKSFEYHVDIKQPQPPTPPLIKESRHQSIRRQWVKEVMESKKEIFKKAELIADHCWLALDEDRDNLVSQALESLTQAQKNQLFSIWKNPEAPLTDQLLFLYYTPVDVWCLENYTPIFKVLKEYALKEKYHLPKHLLTALEIKALFAENKIAEAIAILNKKKIPHLHLANKYKPQTSEYQLALLHAKRQNKHRSVNYLHYWEGDFSGIDFSGANLLGATFYKSKLNNTKFNKSFLFESHFWDTICVNADFREACMNYSILSGNFDGSNFTGSLLYAVNIDSYYQSGDDRARTSFANANFTTADLRLMHANQHCKADEKIAINFSDAIFFDCNLKGARDVLQSMPDDVIRNFIKILTATEPYFKPFMDYLDNWKKQHNIYSFFGIEPPIKAYYIVLATYYGYTISAKDKLIHDWYLENPDFQKILGQLKHVEVKKPMLQPAM